MSYETSQKFNNFFSCVFLCVLYIYNNMTLSKREKLGIMFALVVIGLVLFFTVGRS